MVLSLVTPVGSNFIKDWPSQNTVNCNAIDDYAGPCLTTHPIQSYVPVLTGSTTNPIIGAGTIKGFYYEIFDQIYTWGEFRYGTGGNKGLGTYEISLPFPAKTVTPPNTGSGGGPILGGGFVWDASVVLGRMPVITQLRTATKIMFSVKMDSGGGGRAVDGADIPIPWTTPDGMSWFARYQRDPG
jgi:hypothetical protein